MDLEEYQKKTHNQNKQYKEAILKALEQGPANQPKLRARLGLGDDDEMICDMCYMLCCELKDEEKIKESNGEWSLI